MIPNQPVSIPFVRGSRCRIGHGYPLHLQSASCDEGVPHLPCGEGQLHLPVSHHLTASHVSCPVVANHLLFNLS